MTTKIPPQTIEERFPCENKQARQDLRKKLNHELPDNVGCGCANCELRGFFTSSHDTLLDQAIEKIEEKKGEGEEWVKMMKAAKSAGFSKMESPDDFISGKNFALTLVQEILREMRE
jgi:hypothetical protein